MYILNIELLLEIIILTLNGKKKNIKYILKKKVMFVYKAISTLKYKVIKKIIRKE